MLAFLTDKLFLDVPDDGTFFPLPHVRASVLPHLSSAVRAADGLPAVARFAADLLPIANLPGLSTPDAATAAGQNR